MTSFVVTAMKHSAANGDLPSLARLTRSPEYSARVIEILPFIGDADSPETAVDLFRQAVDYLGAEAGVFICCLRDDATRATYRSLLACDPMWASEYARLGWYDHDPWLRHAAHDTEPVRSSELKATSAEEEAFADASASLEGAEVDSALGAHGRRLHVADVGLADLNARTRGRNEQGDSMQLKNATAGQHPIRKHNRQHSTGSCRREPEQFALPT